MAKSHWLINSSRTEVKVVKNDKSIDGVFEYMFVDTGAIVGVLGKNPYNANHGFGRYRFG